MQAGDLSGNRRQWSCIQPRCRGAMRSSKMGDSTNEAGRKTKVAGGTRREMLQDVLLLSAAAITIPLGSEAAHAAGAQASNPSGKQPATAQSLYDRLGGIFAIAAVVNYFSDELIKDPIAGAQSANPQLREWSTKDLDRLAGLKFMRTLWVANISGGPFQYTPTRRGSTNLGLENAHRNLRIRPSEFDAAA